MHLLITMDHKDTLSEYAGIDRAIAELMVSYHELNGSSIEELREDPSPLEFMRYVAQNKPFVIRGGAENWPACQKWDVPYLKQSVGDRMVTIASTIEGRADAASVRDDQNVLIRPAYTEERFDEAMAYIGEQELRRRRPSDTQKDLSHYSIVKYLQAQNDSLRTEYGEIMSDVPSSIPFARIALQRQPDAVNFWLGNSSSVTQLHKDNYEIIYATILGQKHFVLLPPVDAAAVSEKLCITADYYYSGTAATDEAKLSLQYNKAEERIPFPIWDPDVPDEQVTKFSKFAVPMRVTLNEGDILYLPAQWFHKVSQSCNVEGVCCAVNYWYDMEFSGAFHSAMSFIRNVADSATQTK
ncbi:phospholipase A2 [Viridothelium virens]|uniref:Phospholipase A2 n=1 Tax=Viridothelium virens TaxID=1048519 RepID=A0A6A6HEF5_VIRVR|nr:phospholipase A2 [Viridothelium virens]